MMSFVPGYIYFIGISFLASLTIFRKNIPQEYYYLKLFSIFLGLTLLAETYGVYQSYNNQPNLAFYNFFSVFEFCVYLWIIALIINKPIVKKIIWASIVLYAIAAVINIYYIQKMKAFHSVTYAIGCLLIVISCIYYFFELFRLPKSVKLLNNPAFWICSGLLFFYCCGFPLFGMFNYLSGISKLIIKNFRLIITILNCFLYSLFTIAYLCIKTRKYILSPS